MNEGAIHRETGRNTVGELRHVLARLKLLENRLSLVVKNSNVVGIPASVTIPLYSQAAEPAEPSGFALWYKPASAGGSGETYARIQTPTGTWTWYGPIWYTS